MLNINKVIEFRYKLLKEDRIEFKLGFNQIDY